MNAKAGGEWASLPVAVFYTTDFRELHRYIEYPAIYHKDRIRASQQAARAGETADQAKALLSSPRCRTRRSSTCGPRPARTRS